MKRFQLSIRTLIIIVGTAALCFWIIRYRQRLPPSSWGSSSTFVTEFGNRSDVVPRFLIGTYDANERSPSIGYFVRVTKETDSTRRPSWLIQRNGQVFVNDSLVRYSQDTFQLFVAEDNGPPKRILLAAADAQHFSHGVVGFDQAIDFWITVLRKKYMPSLQLHTESRTRLNFGHAK